MTAGRAGLARYHRLFTYPRAGPLIAFGLIARILTGMNVLAVMLVITTSHYSYAMAGSAAACSAAGAAISGPLRGRLADRRGAANVLLVTGFTQVLAKSPLLLAAMVTLPAPVLLGSGLLAGTQVPPVAAVMRSTWNRMLADDPGLKATAFAWETTVTDLSFIVGPALLAVLSRVVNPESCLGISALCALAGCLGMAALPAVRALPPAAGQRHWLGALRSLAFRRRLPIAFLATGSLSAVDVAALRFAGGAATPASAGYLLAMLSVGSMIGGLAYGMVHAARAPAQRFALTLILLAAGWLVASRAQGFVSLGLVMAMQGVVLGPMMTLQFSEIGRVAPEGAVTESFGWSNSAGQAGGAAAAALTGVLVARSAAERGFLLAAAMTGVAAALVCWFDWKLVRRRPDEAVADR